MTNDRDENARCMRMAIEKAREGIARGQSPFGACIARAGRVASCAHNVVWRTTDITAHAEVHAIRLACEALRGIDLSGWVLYSTCEPCPMCFSAAHWARISVIYFGAGIEDARAAGFHELAISNETMKREGDSDVVLVPRFLRDECLPLFEEWSRRPDRRAY